MGGQSLAVGAGVLLGAFLLCTRAGHFCLLVALGLGYPLHASLGALEEGVGGERWLGYWLLLGCLLWLRGALRAAVRLPGLDGLPEALLMLALYCPPVSGQEVVEEMALLPLGRALRPARRAEKAEAAEGFAAPSQPSLEDLDVGEPLAAPSPPRAAPSPA